VTIPNWVPDAVFYQIFPDRFARSGRVTGLANLEPWDSPPTVYGFKGGDLWGVLENLDYLQDLGVNALYLCPIFQSAANHRYHTHDYYRVDPVLGGDEAFRALLDAAHGRNMRIVLDGVFNHASRGIFQFHHILENGPKSPYEEWFIVNGYPLNAYHPDESVNYAAWWGLPALPKFNHHNPAVREFLFDVARYWTEFGIDGWRLDVPGEIDDDTFWREFRRVVKDVNPEAYLVGEVWTDATRWLQGDQFDGVMNYVWSQAVWGFTLKHRLPKELWPGGHAVKLLDARQFAAELDRLMTLYPPRINYAQLNLLGSHDSPRYLTLAQGNTARFKLALLLLLTAPGAPCIYYGDEVGMQGGADPGCRGGFPWDADRWDHALLDHVRRLVSLRHQFAPLRRGDWRTVYVAEVQDVYAFARRYEDETLVVAVNADEQSFKQPLPVPETCWPEGTRLQDLLGNSGAEVREGRIVGLELAPLTGAILARLQ
jgi:neopullulanase